MCVWELISPARYWHASTAPKADHAHGVPLPILYLSRDLLLMPAGPTITVRKPCLAIRVKEGGQLLFPEKYYAEITPILTELGVPRGTIPVMAQTLDPSEVVAVQEIANQEDFATTIGSILPSVAEWAGAQPAHLTVYI